MFKEVLNFKRYRFVVCREIKLITCLSQRYVSKTLISIWYEFQIMKCIVENGRGNVLVAVRRGMGWRPAREASRRLVFSISARPAGVVSPTRVCIA